MVYLIQQRGSVYSYPNIHSHQDQRSPYPWKCKRKRSGAQNPQQQVCSAKNTTRKEKQTISTPPVSYSSLHRPRPLYLQAPRSAAQAYSAHAPRGGLRCGSYRCQHCRECGCRECGFASSAGRLARYSHLTVRAVGFAGRIRFAGGEGGFAVGSARGQRPSWRG
jgi:hypothetical protein